MFEMWESVETIFFPTTSPSVTPIFPVQVLINPGVLQIIIADDYHWIRINVRTFSKKIVQEAISRDNLTTKRVCMVYIHADEYIIP